MQLIITTHVATVWIAFFMVHGSEASHNAVHHHSTHTHTHTHTHLYNHTNLLSTIEQYMHTYIRAQIVGHIQLKIQKIKQMSALCC